MYHCRGKKPECVISNIAQRRPNYTADLWQEQMPAFGLCSGKLMSCSITVELEKSFISERCAKLVKNRFRCPGKQNLGGSLTVATYQPFGSYFQRRIGEQRLLSCGKFAWGEFTRQSCLWFIWSWGQPLLNRFSFLWTLARTRVCLEWHTFHYFKIKYNLNHSILCVKISEV